MRKTKAADSAADFVLNPITSDDVWDFVQLIQTIGIKEIMDLASSSEYQSKRFTPPTMMKNGEIVPMPREKWTDRQLKKETEAEIAENELRTKITGCVIAHIGETKPVVNRLLARAIGKDEAYIQKMEGIPYIKLLNSFIDRDEFADFFTEALQLLQIPLKIKISSTSDTADQSKN